MVTESHTPQVSKRAEALINLTNYFENFLKQVATQGSADYIESVATQMAIDTFKIVKKAEGFE